MLRTIVIVGLIVISRKS